MERVLNTSELLELILGAVEPRTLLVSATLVCRYWNALIWDSLHLQRALYISPERPSICPKPRANPLLSPHIKRLSLTRSNAVDVYNLLDVTGDIHDKSARFLRTEANWRRMLVQQPPAMTLGVWKIEFSGRGFQHIFETVDLSNTGGLCMSQLLEFSRQWAEQGYTWTLFWGENGQALFEKERNSLLVLKVGMSVQFSLQELRDTSHVIVKLTRWST